MSASSRTRVLLALSGVAVVAALAVLAHAVAARFGLIAGVLLVGGAFAGCGFIGRPRPRREPELTRPAESLPADAGLAA